jgi:hypothetical protein
MNQLNEKAPCAGHARGLGNTHHIANYLSILPRCKYSANYEHGLFFAGLLIQILLDCNFIVWVNGQVFLAQSFEALKNIFNNSEK